MGVAATTYIQHGMKQEARYGKACGRPCRFGGDSCLCSDHLKAADDYPNRPIVLVIPLPPGGTNDIMARSVSDKMSAGLGQRS